MKNEEKNDETWDDWIYQTLCFPQWHVLQYLCYWIKINISVNLAWTSLLWRTQQSRKKTHNKTSIQSTFFFTSMYHIKGKILFAEFVCQLMSYFCFNKMVDQIHTTSPLREYFTTYGCYLRITPYAYSSGMLLTTAKMSSSWTSWQLESKFPFSRAARKGVCKIRPCWAKKNLNSNSGRVINPMS